MLVEVKRMQRTGVDVDRLSFLPVRVHETQVFSKLVMLEGELCAADSEHDEYRHRRQSSDPATSLEGLLNRSHGKPDQPC